jgi:hypothetical protein
MHYRKWVYTLFKLLEYIVPFNLMKWFYIKVTPKSKLSITMNDGTIENLPAYEYVPGWLFVMTKEVAFRYEEEARLKKIESLKREKARLEGDDSEYF